MLARLFALMGMYPVAYYDLSTSGLPVHATAFRPIKQESLDKNPFRLFTSLLRPELIADPEVRKLALGCLERRSVFTAECVRLVEKAERQGGLVPDEAIELVKAAIETFRWHPRSPVSREEYSALASAHKLAADICSFQSIHLNHCTPRTLDIEAVQRGMAERGIPPKALIEGPPPLPCPVLLRQTSFMAVKEPVEFRDEKTGHYVLGHHQARFGEIEQRSLALTLKGMRDPPRRRLQYILTSCIVGRSMYLRLLGEAQRNQPKALVGSPAHSQALDLNALNEEHLLNHFTIFPATYEALRKQDLGFFRYSLSPDYADLPSANLEESTLDDLIQSGHVIYEPLLYEDFLPTSAAGIFQSNLGQSVDVVSAGPDQAGFEADLGQSIIDEMELYESSQQESLDIISRKLGLSSGLRA